MTSIFRAVLVIGLLSLCNVGVSAGGDACDGPRTDREYRAQRPGKETEPRRKKPRRPTKSRVGKKACADCEQVQVSPAKWPRPTCHRHSWTLSLPSDMVRHLQPIGTMPAPKNVPLLPPMFGEKPADNSAFQINGRLLSNEMKLQLRNEERREVEGAALDFEFKQ